MAGRQPSRQEMLNWIDMVSFAVVESNLFLDTHPTDPTALAYFREYVALRNQALKDYAAMYGPLTIDTAGGCQNNWEWVQSPWPWEGSEC